jgi:CRISPR/Cas system-associated endonuclease/helicase Cas3
MKIYTEEQVRKMLFDLGDVLFNNNQNGIKEGEPEKYFNRIIEEYTLIELPSDEEIKNASLEDNNDDLSPAEEFQQGAKWMRNKIQGGNK